MIDQDPWVGRELPKTILESTEGQKMNFPEDLKGHWTLLYFYPKDDTPGCTKQACSYTDSLEKFRNLGGEIYGISLDDIDSHHKFQEKYSLKFPLLADSERKLSTELGVYGEQNWKGKVYQGLSRDTFLVGPEGKIRQVWRKVDPTTTVEETYQALKEFS